MRFIRLHEPEQVAGLRVVVVSLAVIGAIGIAADTQWRLLEALILPRTVEAVRFAIDHTAVIAVEAHRTVAMVAPMRLKNSNRRSFQAIGAMRAMTVMRSHDLLRFSRGERRHGPVIAGGRHRVDGELR